MTFKNIFLIYLAVLTSLILAALLYVRVLLRRYEDAQPEAHVRKAMETLAAEAAGGRLWENYSIPEVTPGKYESDLRERYCGYYTDGALTFSRMPDHYGEDELSYAVERDGFVLAEIRLKAMGPPVTKLAILSYREWEVESVRPLLAEREYTLTLPVGLGIRVNGIEVPPGEGMADGEGMVEYRFPGFYLEPVAEVFDGEGRTASCTVKGNRLLPEIYHYSLTLPRELAVSLNGEPHRGEATGDKFVRHNIVRFEKPQIRISDHYGNVIEYDGRNELPVTYIAIAATDKHSVLVEGKPVPEQDIEMESNPDHTALADYVKDLPQISRYRIAVLKKDAEITLRNGKNDIIPLEAGQTSYDFTRPAGMSLVPDEVAAQVDVLKVAQMWSLFMSKDLDFEQLKPFLIQGSFQYKVALKYATGIDITFTSKHILQDPPFTDEKVTNFVWITNDCFSVDISFVKHMYLTVTEKRVDDTMNDRFYFVRYDDTKDGVDNPGWKLVGMKEIINGRAE